jgi:SAM-dependent methyltransferase
MIERTGGVHKIVTLPALYSVIQRMISGAVAHKKVAERLFAGLEGKRVVEIGCGPGTWAPFLSRASNYIGVDWNEKHIAVAQNTYGSERMRFVRGDLSDADLLPQLDKCDAVIGMGILHHLDDRIAADVLAQAATILLPGGRYIGNEPVRHTGQHPVARLLKSLDSGKNIRTEAGYRHLFGEAFGTLHTQIVTDLIRMPYSHCLISATVQ